MTGRAAGYCAGYPAPGYMNASGGRGYWGGGRGRGAGRGRRNWFYATGLTGWQRAAMGQPAYAAGAPRHAKALGIAIAVEAQQAGGMQVVATPGIGFKVTTVVTLVTGTMFLVWLGEQISERGIGNGISLIIF